MEIVITKVARGEFRKLRGLLSALHRAQWLRQHVTSCNEIVLHMKVATCWQGSDGCNALEEGAVLRLSY